MNVPPAALLLACAVLPWAPAGHAAEYRYRYDTTHSQILFSVDHDGFSRPFGRLRIARGWLRLDPDDFSRAATQVDIDLASLDMGDADWTAAVLRPAFLDAARARYARFTSTSVERIDATHGVLHGRLRLRGVEREVAVPFTFNRQARTIFGMHTVAGFSATAMLDRADFGITAHPGSIGRRVALWLEIEAVREARSTAKEPADDVAQ